MLKQTSSEGPNIPQPCLRCVRLVPGFTEASSVLSSANGGGQCTSAKMEGGAGKHIRLFQPLRTVLVPWRKLQLLPSSPSPVPLGHYYVCWASRGKVMMEMWTIPPLFSQSSSCLLTSLKIFNLEILFERCFSCLYGPGWAKRGLSNGFLAFDSHQLKNQHSH